MSVRCNCDENRFGTEPPTAFNQCNLDLDINSGSRRDICLSAVCFSRSSEDISAVSEEVPTPARLADGCVQCPEDDEG